MTSASRPRPPRKFAALRLTSPAFADGAPLPVRFTADGANVAPPLAWSGVPEAARELVLLMEDPDAYTADPWVHWLVYGISRSLTMMPEGGLPADACRTGCNSWSAPVYRGPQPPRGRGLHRYRFRLLAIGGTLDLPAGARRQQVLDASGDCIIAEAVLTGVYGR